DNVLAEWRQRALPGFTIQPQSVAVGHYVGVLAAQNGPLRDAVNEILRIAMQDGSLESIFRKWGVWNDDQRALYARVIGGRARPPVIGLDALSSVTLSGWEAAWRYLPSLLRASLVT